MKDNETYLHPLTAKDTRDERPLNMLGRFLMPTDAKGQVSKFWSKSDLIVKGRTAEAKQLPGADMLRIQDPSGLPSTNSDEPVRGAWKYVQIGSDGASKIFEALMDTCLLDLIVLNGLFPWVRQMLSE